MSQQKMVLQPILRLWLGLFSGLLLVSAISAFHGEYWYFGDKQAFYAAKNSTRYSSRRRPSFRRSTTTLGSRPVSCAIWPQTDRSQRRLLRTPCLPRRTRQTRGLNQSR